MSSSATTLYAHVNVTARSRIVVRDPSRLVRRACTAPWAVAPRLSALLAVWSSPVMRQFIFRTSRGTGRYTVRPRPGKKRSGLSALCCPRLFAERTTLD
eukprot:3066992-Prymnesium_polylepis.1